MKVTRCGVVLVLCAVIIGLAAACAAADLEGARVDALLPETQRSITQADGMAAVWWLPEEFWILSERESPSMTKEEFAEMLAALRAYTLVAVVEGRMSALGTPTFEAEAKVRSHTTLKDRHGTRYQPLPPESAAPTVRALLASMRPIFAGVLGPMGENMHLLLFPAKTKSGEPICEAQREGSFSVEVGANEFRWRLPLGSLLPPKSCPTCGEKLSGAYKFCPWDGTKLPEPAAKRDQRG